MENQRENRDKVWTYEDLEKLPENPRKRYEILDGVLVVSASPSTVHQRAVGNLYSFLRGALEDTKRAVVFPGNVDVVMSSTRVAIPDLLVVGRERRAVVQERGVFGAPDLVVEVISPRNTKHDRVTKRRMYARSKVREYWLIEPFDQTVEVLELIDGGLSYRQAGFYMLGDRVKSEVFDIELDVDAIFADPFADE